MQVSHAWVSRFIHFIHRHKDDLLLKWNNAMDSSCHAANSPEKHKLYFELLQHK
ncbi:hypothetical protein EJ02DRAFT_457093 [Clathrospora elynae]|uniref:HTH CENPB-type domain-containing protein n=1 Tax=Clathrospora elynae TaxID=706981 RepID=A0A6A5SL22_9PLEO|nr:hypothetical protein EJ02DRAFT_457093 [Clathrospora elynae]